MTNPKILCFLWGFGIVCAYGTYYVYVNWSRIRQYIIDWACYELCKTLCNEGIPIEPADNWVHERAIKYAIAHNKKAFL